MKHVKPYLIMALSVIVILTIYKVVLQKFIPASAQAYLPQV